MPRAGLTRDRVVRTGAEIADAEGLDAATPSAVARAVGVRTASLYSHLDGAAALRTGIALLALEEMTDLAADAVAGRSGREAVTAFAEVYRDYARTHPGRYAASRTPLDPTTAAASAGPRHARLLRSVLRSYALPEPDETHAVRLLGSLLHGFVSLELAGGFDHSRPSPAVTWDWLLDALDAVLSRPATPASTPVPTPAPAPAPAEESS